MNQRERLFNTLSFRAVDRIPFWEFEVRKSTVDIWIEQGYPKGVPSEQFFGLDTLYLKAPFKLKMNPPFEEKIIELNEKYKICLRFHFSLRKADTFLRWTTPFLQIFHCKILFTIGHLSKNLQPAVVLPFPFLIQSTLIKKGSG